jgi:transcriptional regulator with XRE-family HTH domain
MDTGIGQRIRAARLKYGMSQAELARRVRVSTVAMNDLEMGRTVDPHFSVVERIARALHISLDTFAQEAGHV